MSKLIFQFFYQLYQVLYLEKVHYLFLEDLYSLIFFRNKFFIRFVDNSIYLIGEPNILGGPNRNPLSCAILNKLVFESFMLVDEPFDKVIRVIETSVSINNNLCGKLISSLEFPIKFEKRFKFTSVPFFISDFNVLSCELDNFRFNALH